MFWPPLGTVLIFRCPGRKMGLFPSPRTVPLRAVLADPGLIAHRPLQCVRAHRGGSRVICSNCKQMIPAGGRVCPTCHAAHTREKRMFTTGALVGLTAAALGLVAGILAGDNRIAIAGLLVGGI